MSLDVVPFPHQSISFEMPVLSPPEQWTIALTRHISGNLSVAASSIIVYHVVLRVLKDRRSQRRDLVTPYHRLMLGFSIADILYSFSVGLSTLAVPKSSEVIYGFGTTSTCTMQGFFVQFSVATYLYTATLSLYFLFKIRYNVSDDTLYHRYEMWFHVIPWTVAIGTGAMGVALQIFNPMTIPELGCWIGPFPADCFNPEGPPCTRGYRLETLAGLYAFVMAYLWLFVSFVIVLVSNILIYRSVRGQERRNEQYLGSKLQNQWSLSAVAISEPATVAQQKLEDTPPPVVTDERPVEDSNDKCAELDTSERESGTATDKGLVVESPRGSSEIGHSATGHLRRQSATQRSTKASRTACTQSILYVSAAGFTIVWTFLSVLSYHLRLSTAMRFFAVLMVSLFYPMQGVFNLMIYVRLEYLRLRASRRDLSRIKCIRSCLFSPDLSDPGLFKSRRRLGHNNASTELK
jgi:hypothetical protein